ncbi:MAG: hypothetical protein QOE77_106 [Blastocatellia bacterium]|nr:hypothetical protein [Blastocatellia bacterium]
MAPQLESAMIATCSSPLKATIIEGGPAMAESPISKSGSMTVNIRPRNAMTPNTDAGARGKGVGTLPFAIPATCSVKIPSRCSRD